jgi:hypothetical protein
MKRSNARRRIGVQVSAGGATGTTLVRLNLPMPADLKDEVERWFINRLRQYFQDRQEEIPKDYAAYFPEERATRQPTTKVDSPVRLGSKTLKHWPSLSDDERAWCTNHPVEAEKVAATNVAIMVIRKRTRQWLKTRKEPTSEHASPEPDPLG